MSDTGDGKRLTLDGPDYLVGDLRKKAAEMDVDTFTQLLSAPALVSPPKKHTVEDEWSFRTGSFTAVRDEESGVFFDLPDEHEVRCIKKRADVLFKDTILIGRTDACDVVIRDASISKLHARIRVLDNGERYCITDANSSNGTSVDHVRLVADVETDLPDAGILALGSVAFHLLSPPRLWRLLRKLENALS